MNSRRGSPMKKNKNNASECSSVRKITQKLFVDQQQNCLLTDFTTQEIQQQKLMTTDICYHKLYEDLLNQIDEANAKIQQEISESQVELQDAIQEMMDNDALYPSDDFKVIKLRNQLNINLAQSYNDQRFSSSAKEEIKEMAINKISKVCAPNFSNESKINYDYKKFIPQDQNEIRKSALISDQATLDNSYVPHLNISNHIQDSSNIIAQNLHPNIHSIFTLLDFKPSNPEYLLLSRLDFMTKQQKITNYLKNQIRERSYEIEMNQSYYNNLQKQWLKNAEVEQRSIDKVLKSKYPQIYDEFQFEQKHHPGILSSNQYQEYHPLQGQIAQSFPKDQNADDDEEEEEWDEVQRYRENQIKPELYRYRIYNAPVQYEPFPQLILDPEDFATEYKRMSVWSIKDIETFLKLLLENPKNFWVIGKQMNHKTSKDLIFFFQTFKKLFNLKKHFKTCFVLMSLPTQMVKKQAIQDIVNDILKPLQKYQLENRGSTAQWDINSGVAQNFTGQNQIYFTIEELLKIYASNSECRRKSKEVEKEKTKNKGYYHFNASSAPQYQKIDQTKLLEHSYFSEIEQRGSMILDKYNQKLEEEINHNPENSQYFSTFVQRCALNMLIYQNYQSHHPQNLIMLSLQGQSEKENILKKRKFQEHFLTSNFGSGSGRNVNQWVIYKQHLYEDQSTQSKRLKLTSMIQQQQHPSTLKVESFTKKYVEELNNRQANKKATSEEVKEQILINGFNNHSSGNLNKVNELQAHEETYSLIGGQIQMDIKNDFPNEKEYQTYMDQRFKQIFINKSEDSFEQDESNQKRKGLLQWQEDEKEQFIQLLKKNGRDWDAISKELPRKTDKQCRNYFQNYKHKLNLIQYLPDKNK